MELAIEKYSSVLDSAPQNIKAYEHLGIALTQQGKGSEAIEIYERAIQIHPRAASLYENLGLALQSQNQLLRAIVAYRHALALDPSRTLALYNLGRLWLNRGDYGAAAECFQQLIALQPNKIEVYSSCATALLLQGKLEQAVDYLRQVIVQQPEFALSFCSKVGQVKPTQFIDSANLCFARLLQAILEKGPLEEIAQSLQETYIYLGDIEAIYWRNYQAEYYYQSALKINPNKVELYPRLGKVLERQEKLEAAIVVYHLGLTLEPSHPQLNYQLAQVLEKQQRLEQAINYYEKVLRVQLTGGGKDLKVSHSLERLPRYPQGIYLSTQEWMRDRGLAKDYLRVQWGEKGKEEKGIEKILQPGQKKSQEKCAGVNCLPCLGKMVSRFQPTWVSEKVFFCRQKEPIQIEQPPTFVATIPEGRVWIAPYQDTLRMCREIAVITPDNYLLHDLSRDYPWYLPDCTDHDPTVHSLFTVEEMPPVERIDGTVAILSTLSGDIYYHWTIDLLPRIGILERSGIDWDKIDRFVVNSIGKGFQRETLEVLGIPKEKIIESDRHPHLQAKELIVPSFAGHLGSPRAFSLQFLRDKFFRTSRQQYPDKIYVSRAKAKHRQVINDTEVTNLLSRYGFETVFLEELSLREQTALFSQARVIVSAHGAGLTNLVFCTQGATVVEIFSPNYTRTYYLAISNLLGLKHYYLMGENLRCDLIRNLMYKSTLFEDIFVNLDYLETIIKKIQ